MTGQTPAPKPRVVVIHPALAPYRLDQFNLLSELFDVTVVFLFDNVWNHPFDQQRLLSQARFKHLFLLKGWEHKGRVFTRWGLLRTIRRLRPDVVVSVEFSFATQLLTLLKVMGLLKPRLATMVDDSLDIARRPQSRARGTARALIVRNLDTLVVLSRPVADFYKTTYRLTDRQVVVAPILQDSDRLRSDAATLDALAAGYADRFQLRGRRVVLFVGRLIVEKGVLPFLQHVQAVLAAAPDVRFVVVGDGAQRDPLQRFVQQAGLAGQVLLAGRHEDAALRAWYVCASGFVLPSLYEPFGAVVNEALIFGLPVLCSSAAGSAPLALEAGGAVFEPADALDTRQTFGQFLDVLPAMQTFETAARPSLVAGRTAGLRDEWSKLYGD